MSQFELLKQAINENEYAAALEIISKNSFPLLQLSELKDQYRLQKNMRAYGFMSQVEATQREFEEEEDDQNDIMEIPKLVDRIIAGEQVKIDVVEDDVDEEAVANILQILRSNKLNDAFFTLILQEVQELEVENILASFNKILVSIMDNKDLLLKFKQFSEKFFVTESDAFLKTIKLCRDLINSEDLSKVQLPEVNLKLVHKKIGQQMTQLLVETISTDCGDELLDLIDELPDDKVQDTMLFVVLNIKANKTALGHYLAALEDEQDENQDDDDLENKVIQSVKKRDHLQLLELLAQIDEDDVEEVMELLMDDPESLEFLMKFVGGMETKMSEDVDETKLKDLINLLVNCRFPSDKENLIKFIEALDAYERDNLIAMAAEEVKNNNQCLSLLKEVATHSINSDQINIEDEKKEVEMPPSDYARVLINLLEDFKGQFDDGMEETEELSEQVVDYLQQISLKTRKIVQKLVFEGLIGKEDAITMFAECIDAANQIDEMGGQDMEAMMQQMMDMGGNQKGADCGAM